MYQWMCDQGEEAVARYGLLASDSSKLGDLDSKTLNEAVNALYQQVNQQQDSALRFINTKAGQMRQA